MRFEDPSGMCGHSGERAEGYKNSAGSAAKIEKMPGSNFKNRVGVYF